jgi:hypothetical protein
MEWNELKGDRQVKKEDCVKLFTDAGFEKEKEFSAGDSHYGILFVKK